MVEQDRRTAALITRNAGALGFATGSASVAATVATLLAGHPRRALRRGVLRPPSTRLPDTDVDADLAALVGRGWLVPGALVIVERAAKRSPA